MNRIKTALVVLTAILFTAGIGSAREGVIAPGLMGQLDRTAQDASIRALVVLKDQVDVPSLDQELREARAPLSERHEVVIRALQEKAKGSQPGLLAELAAEKAAGRVKGFASHWLINAVLVEGTPDVLRSLALREDVEKLEADLVIRNGSHDDKGGSDAPAPASPTNVGNGLQALGVPEVWRQLGFDGTGQIVGIMDTGVDAAHPALAESWRGNSAPANECWLDLIDTGSPNYPVDVHYLGTVHAGLMVGHANGDTVGVAPGAEWIASNHLFQYSGPEFDADVITSLEFMADPDGNPATMNDVPAVVLNAWGIEESYEGYFDCDNRWWDAMDACEAAGPVLIFSVGDHGPGSSTIWSPADRASTETAGFSVGAASDQAPFTVADFSSRGPSGCGGLWETKPEVVAPGIEVTTTYPDNQWVYYTSSSGAAAQVAGVVALMRQAAPDADAETIKQALLTTARDQDDPGDDNTSGRGFVDAYAAVLAVMPNIGTASGTVTDLGTGFPIAGATLAQVGGNHIMTSDEAGVWTQVMPTGSYDFQVTAPGYYDGTVTVEVVEGMNTVADVVLDPRPQYLVSGIVTGPDDLPVVGAEVLSLTPPTISAFTDLTGAYSMMLPGGPGLDHSLVAWGPWEGDSTADFILMADLSLDFSLPEKLGDGFETGGLQLYNWTCPDDGVWVVDESLPRSGRFSVHSPELRSGGLSSLVLDFYAASAGQLTFHFRVDNYPQADFLSFYMDDDIKGEWTGDIPWTSFTMDVPQGHHVFEWVHLQNSGSFDEPTVWLDDISLPPTAPESLAAINLDVAAIDAVVEMGATTTSVFNVTNTGDHDLDIAIRPETANKSAGGPDGWGYIWQDSDEPNGPAYDWVDILTDGNATDLGNEELIFEVNLGFPFLFYGELFSELNISANGFLSFTSASAAYLNRTIPNPVSPNALIAPFWDDLNPATGSGEVYWKSEPENGRFIVTWDNVNHDGTSTPETFQVILNVDGSIVFQYALVNNPASCTVGLENADGDDGLQVVWNDATYLHSGLAIRVNPVSPVPWLSCDPWFARIQPGATLPIEIEFDATDLPQGVHPALLKIASNDRTAGELTLPLQLTVTAVSGVPDLPLAPVFSGAVPNPFNPITELRFSLPVRSQVTLKVYDLKGRLVRSLLSGWLEAGPHAEVWNGQNDQGQGVASGNYFARLEVNGVPTVRGMTLVR